MELLAAGYNAFHQLSFQQDDLQEHPNDYHSFVKVLRGANLSVKRSTLYSTTVAVDGSLRNTGRDSGIREDDDCPRAISGTNQVLEAACTETGNNMLLSLFASLGDYSKHRVTRQWPVMQPVRDIAAYDAGFIVLLTDGTVLTMGDARYADCLGREVSAQQASDEPHPVSDLQSLGDKVVQIAAGGYTLAALTESGSLYLWGMSTSGKYRARQAFPSLEQRPNYVEVDGEKDVVHVGIGESHAVALTSDGAVYAIGSNRNGQLGLGRNSDLVRENWTRLKLDNVAGRVIAVYAGPRASFVIATVSSDWQ